VLEKIFYFFRHIILLEEQNVSQYIKMDISLEEIRKTAAKFRYGELWSGQMMYLPIAEDFYAWVETDDFAEQYSEISSKKLYTIHSIMQIAPPHMLMEIIHEKLDGTKVEIPFCYEMMLVPFGELARSNSPLVDEYRNNIPDITDDDLVSFDHPNCDVAAPDSGYAVIDLSTAEHATHLFIDYDNKYAIFIEPNNEPVAAKGYKKFVDYYIRILGPYFTLIYSYEYGKKIQGAKIINDDFCASWCSLIVNTMIHNIPIHGAEIIEYFEYIVNIDISDRLLALYWLFCYVLYKENFDVYSQEFKDTIINKLNVAISDIESEIQKYPPNIKDKIRAEVLDKLVSLPLTTIDDLIRARFITQRIFDDARWIKNVIEFIYSKIISDGGITPSTHEYINNMFSLPEPGKIEHYTDNPCAIL